MIYNLVSNESAVKTVFVKTTGQFVSNVDMANAFVAKLIGLSFFDYCRLLVGARITNSLFTAIFYLIFHPSAWRTASNGQKWLQDPSLQKSLGRTPTAQKLLSDPKPSPAPRQPSPTVNPATEAGQGQNPSPRGTGQNSENDSGLPPFDSSQSRLGADGLPAEQRNHGEGAPPQGQDASGQEGDSAGGTPPNPNSVLHQEDGSDVATNDPATIAGEVSERDATVDRGTEGHEPTDIAKDGDAPLVESIVVGQAEASHEGSEADAGGGGEAEVHVDPPAPPVEPQVEEAEGRAPTADGAAEGKREEENPAAMGGGTVAIVGREVAADGGEKPAAPPAGRLGTGRKVGPMNPAAAALAEITNIVAYFKRILTAEYINNGEYADVFIRSLMEEVKKDASYMLPKFTSSSDIIVFLNELKLGLNSEGDMPLFEYVGRPVPVVADGGFMASLGKLFSSVKSGVEKRIWNPPVVAALLHIVEITKQSRLTVAGVSRVERLQAAIKLTAELGKLRELADKSVPAAGA